MGLEISVKVEGTSPFGQQMANRLNSFRQEAKNAGSTAARAAQRTTNKKFRRMRPPAPPRLGRPTGLAKVLKWDSIDTYVYFNQKSADRTHKYWIIQEIGTNASAVLREGGTTNPKGRPTKNAKYVKTVKSQKGRPISTALVWGRSIGGKYVEPRRGGRADQLFLYSDLENVPRYTRKSPRRRTRMFISREITGKGMIEAGSIEGFTQLTRLLHQAGESAFRN